MTDNKFLIVVVFTLTVFIAIAYSLHSFEKSKLPVISQNPQLQFAQLESQIQQLKSAVDTFTQLNLSLHKSLNEEKEKALEVKEKALGLQEKLKETVEKKENLAGELAKAKENLELTQPIKQKLDQIEGALAQLQFSPDQASQLLTQLDSLGKELDAINRSMPSLVNENNAYKLQVQALSELLSKKEQELKLLKQDTEQTRIHTESVERDLNAISGQLSSVAEEKIRLAEKAAEAKNAMQMLPQQEQASTLTTEVKRLTRELESAQTRETRLAQEKQQALEEAESYKKSLAALTKKNQEMEKDLSNLKQNLEKLNKEYAGIKIEHENAQLLIKQNEAELAKHRETITYMKERLEEADAKAFEIYSRYKELKKESAVLREQNVNMQLEKEGLRDNLTQTQTRLNELQNKFQKISTMMNTGEELRAGTAEQQKDLSSSKMVDVELLPQNNSLSNQ